MYSTIEERDDCFRVTFIHTQHTHIHVRIHTYTYTHIHTHAHTFIGSVVELIFCHFLKRVFGNSKTAASDYKPFSTGAVFVTVSYNDFDWL